MDVPFKTCKKVTFTHKYENIRQMFYLSYVIYIISYAIKIGIHIHIIIISVFCYIEKNLSLNSVNILDII